MSTFSPRTKHITGLHDQSLVRHQILPFKSLQASNESLHNPPPSTDFSQTPHTSIPSTLFLLASQQLAQKVWAVPDDQPQHYRKLNPLPQTPDAKLELPATLFTRIDVPVDLMPNKLPPILLNKTNPLRSSAGNATPNDMYSSFVSESRIARSLV